MTTGGKITTQPDPIRSHYTTVADRFANLSIRRRAQHNASLHMPEDRHRFSLASETDPEKSLMKTTLNQKSQMSEAFCISVLRGSMEKGSQGNEGELIRGVPKFIKSNRHGARYVTRKELDRMNMDHQIRNTEQSVLQ